MKEINVDRELQDALNELHQQLWFESDWDEEFEMSEEELLEEYYERKRKGIIK
jgi:hypothetical protein